MITIRPVEDSDIDIFYEHQSDPVAVQMAATQARDQAGHLELWTKRILNNPSGLARTVVVDGSVAGNILSWVDEEGKREVGYRYGREFWGRGIATDALRQFLDEVRERPIHAATAAHNIGSQRVLEKVGFIRVSHEPTIADDGVALFEFVLN